MLTAKKTFQKRTENFCCGQCGKKVQGNGYTNHCPRCLYGKHVDIHPGDRAERCGGLMEPIFLEKDNGEEKLTHRCVLCGYEKKNKTAENDDFEALLALSRRLAR